MANADWAHGLLPVNNITGPVTGRITRYFHHASDGTAIYIGSLVKKDGTNNSDGIDTMAVTANVSTGNDVIGVVVGIIPATEASTPYLAASTAGYVLVNDDPNQIYRVQDDAASTPTAANIGNSADLTGFTSGSTVTGYSATEISVAAMTASGDGSEDVLIVGIYRAPDNSIGNNTEWLVKLNNHFFKDSSAGA